MSLGDLERELPALASQATPGREIDWEVVEEGLGTGLPGDFRQLCERYQYLVLDRFLSVHVVAPGEQSTYTASVWHDIGSLGILAGPDARHPHVPYVAGTTGGLIPWASSVEGDVWYWRVAGADPDRWPVVVGNRNDDCEDWAEFPTSATAYLVGLIRGEIPGHGLPEGFPARAPEVHADTWPTF
ncbi:MULTISPECIES: hypothetical protein [Streptomyces]|uniref:SMI1/KNR4 family protein n=1 Tax=Streptomyces koyangensis TaxID=188770 RepID=A0A385DAC7_9ACTN|nr:hypothetical protein [Streptomyces koyangensis]AXQ54667.1 hypothetical protein D0C37_08685 [Streptomyces koyangensis]WTD05456.1 hypothetical protein OH717_24195 [Streptomyces albidoflavus]